MKSENCYLFAILISRGKKAHDIVHVGIILDFAFNVSEVCVFGLDYSPETKDTHVGALG